MKMLFGLMIVVLSLMCHNIHAQTLPSPAEFIGEEYGAQFTPHHKLVSYFQEISKDSRVDLQNYGETNEGRPLYLAIVSSEKNQNNIEQIRKKNLALAHMEESAVSDEDALPIVWLSYSVHGNEAGGSESSMNVIYNLLTDKAYESILNEVVVIIDPSLNPDGYSRYSHWVRGVSGKKLHPLHTDVEHMEPWPGGRVNHYLFDLNRDWAWQTQVETQQRIKKYNQWMPHIHADLHEMGYDDHYYFAPAAEPFHKAITDYQRELQHEIGLSNAATFDENSWLYFTREIFDLLYPSYGDTWPTFNGSVGMTYEQAGHGMSGRSIEMSNHKNLTLQDRIDHHTATSLSTVRTAARERKSIISNFKKYFDQAIDSRDKKYAAYLVKDGATIGEFKSLLSRNGIDYAIVNNAKSLNAYSYFKGTQSSLLSEEGDVYIPTAQPKATLLKVLMEEEPILADSVTYDITSWCVPFAYGLETYGLKNKMSADNFGVGTKTNEKINVPSSPYAIFLRWGGNSDAKKILGELFSSGLTVKRTSISAEYNQVKLYPGDVVILRGDQVDLDAYDDAIRRLSKLDNSQYGFITTGFATKGKDLGGSGLQRIEQPTVLTFFGDGVDANAYGQIWNYFENSLDFPISRVDIGRIDDVSFSNFNTIILPDGYYDLSESQRNNLREWVRNGGKLISMSGANRNFKDDNNFALGGAPKSEKLDKDSDKVAELRYKKRKYEGAERRSIAGSIPGAIFKTEIDKTHPLCFGIDTYYTLKNSSMHFPLLGGNSFNPIRIPANYTSFGFIGSSIQKRFEETSVVSIELMGSGQVVYLADNPLFRAFWKNGEVLFTNIIFQL